MRETIETGIVIPGTSKELSNYMDLVETYQCSHVQIQSYELENLINVSKYFQQKVKTFIDYSFRIEVDKPNNVLIKNPEDVFISAKKYSIKYIVVSGYFPQYTDWSKVPLYDNLEKIIKKAEEGHTLLCLEIPVDILESQNGISYLQKIKERYPSRFLLFSLYLKDLHNLSKLTPYLNQLRLSIATVTTHFNYKDLENDDFEMKFSQLIGTLFYLPYKQQPILFDGSLNDINKVLLKFQKIVDENGYEFF